MIYIVKLLCLNGTIVNSDVIRIPWYSVVPNQKKDNGISFGSVSYWYKGSLKDNSGLSRVYIPRYDPKILQAETDIVFNPQEKYHSWSDNRNNTYYNNFVRFSISSILTNTMTSQFHYTNNAAVRARVDNSYLDVINFKDPWLRDFNETPFGIRNQGLSAQFKPLANTDNNLPIDPTRQGVLLNQNDTTRPMYKISIPSSINLPQNRGTHNIYLQSWDVSGAQLQYPNSLNTGVVFTSGNATVTANVKATQLSNTSTAFNNNGQRKIIRTPDIHNTVHMVYESMGHVWYETSTDNGSTWTWTLMNNGHPVDNGGGKCPSINFIHFSSSAQIYVVILYQEPSYGGFSNLTAKVYKDFEDLGNFTNTQTIVVDYTSDIYSEWDENPVLSIDYYGETIIVWESGMVYITVTAGYHLTD